MFVYKYVFNGEVIYVGIAKKLENRLSQHGKKGDNIDENGWSEINKSKIFYTKVANEVMADVIESELIRFYKPKYNKAKTSEWSGLPFIEKELTWKEFKKISKTSSFKKKLKRVISFHEDNTLKDIVKDFTSKNSICKFFYSINNFTEKELILVKYILSDIDKKIYNININIDKTIFINLNNLDSNMLFAELREITEKIISISFSINHDFGYCGFSIFTGHFNRDGQGDFQIFYNIEEVLNIKECIEDKLQKYPNINIFYNSFYK